VILFGPESFVFHFVIQNLKIKIYRTIVLAAFSLRCQNVTLREEHRLRLFGNRMLRMFLGTKRD